PGNILPLYIGLYFAGRLWIEALRIDTASTIGPFRINIWMSIIGIGGAILVFITRGVRRRASDVDEPYRDGHVWSPVIPETTDPSEKEETE
ncbi:MAG: prolipoprotein diacylglyceryl transferase, partial [Actinobacteria bacterium]|nr:prolipoprotein diacylglyceryl transferase [Actinomycetota bacterium]